MSRKKISVWDPLIRVFHWSLVIVITIAWFSGEDSETLHELVGYVALGLIGFRVIWGFVGSSNARFSKFVRGPKQTLNYIMNFLKLREKRYVGHNPLGALMVVCLLFTTAATGVSGWLLVEPERLAMAPDILVFAAPALADDDDEEEEDSDYKGKYKKSKSNQEEALEEIHEVLANLLLLLIFLHILGVIYASIRHKENLPLAMVSGKKNPPGPDDIV